MILSQDFLSPFCPVCLYVLVAIPPMPVRRHPILLLRILFPAIALGLAWAVRGHFGHEWGAAWAGAIGSMAVLLSYGRQDWLHVLPVTALMGAIGWGAGGMMSYGIVVGYGRGTDFLNVFYGLAMLGVIGGLYGFIGGGLMGGTLESTKGKRMDWARVLTEMVAGAVLSWGLLIYQLEWFMTPPRSELWAACFGAALALGWYLKREGFENALHIAIYAGLGAGFGFAFGNFLQVAGNTTGLAFNWWNVMEFSLGFFGGLGMAYGVFSCTWEEQCYAPSPKAITVALIAILVAIPVTNLVQVFETDKFIELAEQLGRNDIDSFVHTQQLLGWGSAFLFISLCMFAWKRKSYHTLFFLFTILYVVESHFRKGLFYDRGALQIEQYLYWLDIVLLVGIWSVFSKKGEIAKSPSIPLSSTQLLLVFVFVIGILSLVAIQLHDGLPGAHERF